jgi:hypothetical protein
MVADPPVARIAIRERHAAGQNSEPGEPGPPSLSGPTTLDPRSVAPGGTWYGSPGPPIPALALVIHILFPLRLH